MAVGLFLPLSYFRVYITPIFSDSIAVKRSCPSVFSISLLHKFFLLSLGKCSLSINHSTPIQTGSATFAVRFVSFQNGHETRADMMLTAMAVRVHATHDEATSENVGSK
jgi:hypothetical protein